MLANGKYLASKALRFRSQAKVAPRKTSLHLPVFTSGHVRPGRVIPGRNLNKAAL